MNFMAAIKTLDVARTMPNLLLEQMNVPNSDAKTIASHV